ncbi:uncharacterized protein LOC134806602 [Cydia splendana]|uniref:uncharacterized protein LOC134806602 n=1 Tax=Cydia splendana TaxID=1100963 RepID=UPI00300BFB0B
MSGNDAFNRSSRTPRSPPPEGRPAMETTPGTPVAAARAEAPDVVSTTEIQKWISEIEKRLSEICTIANDGKLNSDQKLRINTLSKSVLGGISQLAVQYQAVKQNLLLSQAKVNTLSMQTNISTQLYELKQCIQEKATTEEKQSFADMVRTGKSSTVVPTKSSSSIAIYPADKEKSSEDTKNLIQNLIKPETLKLHVRGMRKTKNGGVIISTERKDDLEKLKASQQLQQSGLKVEDTTKRRPKIIILGVPTNMSEGEVFDCIFKQNIADLQPNLTRDTFMCSVKLSHKSGKKDLSTCNYILECTAEVRRMLIQQQRVFINWTSCPVRDFTLLTRCYLCHLYGHSAKYCKDTEPTCGHCGSSGHGFKECPKQAEPAKCATCLRFKKPANHKTGDDQCPAKKNAQLRYINSIDYEGA